MSGGMMDRTGTRIMAGTWNSKKSLMGVETPIPPVMINARRPEGRPAAGFWEVEENSLMCVGSNRLAPPCLGEALRRGAIVKYWNINRLSGQRCEQNLTMSNSLDMKQQQNGVRT